ncbi:MAG: hypothetical protein WED12_01960 [Chloroflexota bacterium]
MRIRPCNLSAVALMLAAVLGACAAQPATDASPQVVYVLVTPAPTPTPRPSPEATVDPRPAWFAAACEAAQRLARATDGWIQAVDRPSQSADEALEWAYLGRDALRDARSALADLPDWPRGAEFARLALRLADWLEQEFDRIEAEPEERVPLETLYEYSGLRRDLSYAAGGVHSVTYGCDLGLLIW